jgi:hypothetical protein
MKKAWENARHNNVYNARMDGENLGFYFGGWNWSFYVLRKLCQALSVEQLALTEDKPKRGHPAALAPACPGQETS